MFERFTEEARRVVVLAQEEARAADAGEIGPAHLLLGVAMAGGPGEQAMRDAGLAIGPLRDAVRQVGEDAAIDPAALAALGVDLDQVRARAEEAFGPGALDAARGRRRRSGHLPFTTGAKKALEQSLRATLRRGDRAIGSDHVLLGTLAVDDPAVRELLRRLDVDAADLRRRLGDQSDAA
jgi:ATP-dependent Clp protease ATP-binding subunit ClpA